MELAVDLAALPIIHPQLEWSDMSTAAVAVFVENGAESPFDFDLAVKQVPGFDDDLLRMQINHGKITDARVARLRRTYERTRLVEMAAIAIAGLGLYYAGGHVIHDIALRGTAADYLVDEENYLLEIGGRSRRSDFESAWQQKWQQLLKSSRRDFYLFVAEFENRTGRLAFKD